MVQHLSKEPQVRRGSRGGGGGDRAEALSPGPPPRSASGSARPCVTAGSSPSPTWRLSGCGRHAEGRSPLPASCSSECCSPAVEGADSPRQRRGSHSSLGTPADASGWPVTFNLWQTDHLPTQHWAGPHAVDRAALLGAQAAGKYSPHQQTERSQGVDLLPRRPRDEARSR